MGSGQSRLLEKGILDAEIEILRQQKLCDPDALGIFEEDLKYALKSLVPETPDNVLDAFSNGTLSQEHTEIVKAAILDQVNEFQVSKDLSSRFYDFRLMYLLTCVFGNLWHINRETLEATSYTQKYFRITENLSTGEYGIVLKGQRGGSGLNFIIKSQMVPQNAELSIHEMFVAIVGTNNLRAYCPNFSCIYGGFFCGDANVLEGKICTGNFQVPYTVYEAVEGKTFGSQMEALVPMHRVMKAGIVERLPRNVDIMDPNLTATLYETTFSVLLQINFALRIAYARAFRYTHRDLHHGNVVCRPLQSPNLIRYDSRYFIMDDPEKRVNNIPQPELEPKGPRNIYYVKAEYVATVIDYDFSQIYCMSKSADDDTYILRRFGKGEEDRTERELVSKININRVRDFIKFLGYTTLIAMELRTDRRFHEILCDLYIAMARPYLTVRRDLQGLYIGTIPPSLPPSTFDEKVKIVSNDSKNYFRITDIQGVLIRDSIITMESFVDYFRQLVPPHYQQRVLFETTLVPHPDRDTVTMIDGSPEIDVSDKLAEDALWTKVMKCRGECLGQKDAYDRIMTATPLDEYSQINLSNPANLAYHTIRLRDSQTTFNQSSVSVRARLAGAPLTPGPDGNIVIGRQPIQYKSFLDNRVRDFLTQEKNIKDDHIQRILMLIEQILAFIREGLNILPPIPENFLVEYPKHLYPGVAAYKNFLFGIFKILSAGREAINLNNALVGMRPAEALKFREAIRSSITAITTYFTTHLIPWRNKLALLESQRFFRQGKDDANERLKYAVITKIPTSIDFNPIL